MIIALPNRLCKCFSSVWPIEFFFLSWKTEFFYGYRSMQDTPRCRLYLSTAVDSESNFLDRRGRRRGRNKENERRDGEKPVERGKVCRHTEGLARRPKRITEFVFPWTISHRCRSFFSLFTHTIFLSFDLPLSSRLSHPESSSFYLRNETQWPLCAAQSFDGNFFVKATVTCRAL